MSEQIAAISQVIADLPPGLTAEEIARRVWAVVQPSGSASPDAKPTFSAEQTALLTACRDQGSVSLGPADPRASSAAELAMMGYLTPAASGLDYTLWRLTPRGMQEATQ